jgi:two-component system, sensor histidine kinase YesM
MLLQPIVENAIIHGIENKIGRGIVTVTIERMTDQVRLKVKDNGNGIDPTRLEEIRMAMQMPEEENGQRIGLQNVNQRIKLYYGKEYGCEISGTSGMGTEVTVLLPIRRGPHV